LQFAKQESLHSIAANANRVLEFDSCRCKAEFPTRLEPVGEAIVAAENSLARELGLAVARQLQWRLGGGGGEGRSQGQEVPQSPLHSAPDLSAGLKAARRPGRQIVD